MFKAGVEFALGLGVGCVLLYGIFLSVSLLWFEIDQRLFEKTRRRLTVGPTLLHTQTSSTAAKAAPDKSVAQDTGVGAR